MKKQSLSLILSLLLAGSALLASCGETAQTPGADTQNGDPAGNETAAQDGGETEESVLQDPVAAKDFGGEEFVVMTSSSATQHTNVAYNTQTGEVLDDALYARTKAVEEKYNIHFADDVVPGDAWAANDVFTNSVQAGDDAFDLAMLLERSAFAITGEGYFLDIAELPNIDLSQPWWFADVNATINLTDKTYLSYGSVNLGLYDMMHVLLFNKQMVSDLDLDSPYDLVLSGQWTFDRMAEMAREARSDADGDGAWGTGDIYGFVGGNNTTVVDFLAGARVRSISVDAQKNVEIRLLSDPKIEEIYTKVRETFWDAGFWYTKSQSSNNYYLTDTYFQTNQALFADHTFYSVGLLRDMETDFGIIPFPKFDEAQAEYGTLAEAGTRTMTVPATVGNQELVGSVLETLNFLSYRDVMPAYYEVTLKQKYSRDSISSQMLDIITNAVYYDLGDTMFNDLVKDGLFSTLFKSNKADYVSSATKTVSKLEKEVAKAKGE